MKAMELALAHRMRSKPFEPPTLNKEKRGEVHRPSISRSNNTSTSILSSRKSKSNSLRSPMSSRNPTIPRLQRHKSSSSRSARRSMCAR